MSPNCALGRSLKVSFPRVSGDEPARAVEFSVVLKFSPRERG